MWGPKIIFESPAIVLLKAETDKKDKFLIFKIGDQRMDRDSPNFVMKSSEDMVDQLIKLDRLGSDEIMCEMWVYGDGIKEQWQQKKTLFPRRLCSKSN